MQRHNYYFRQKVSEDEVDSSFDAVEAAIDRIYEDLGLIGIIYQAAVSEHSPTPNMTVDVEAGIVIDQVGQRIYWSSLQNVDMSKDENGVSTAVGSSGNEKWLSLFAKFKRVLTQPRVDGNQETVYYNEAEGFEFRVVQGPEEAAPATTRPALRSDQILLADVKIAFGTTAITNAMIYDDRREWAITAAATSFKIERGQIEDALQDLCDAIDASDAALAAHKASAADEHLASAVNYAGGGTWHSGTTNPAATVEAQLDKLISDLAKDTSPAGADQIGAQAQGGDFPLSQGSVQDQLGQLAGYINTVDDSVNDIEISNTWHDDSGIDATTAESAIEEIVSDLAATAGADRVGSTAKSSGLLALSSGSIHDQLLAALGLIDGVVKDAGKVRVENWDFWADLFSSGYSGKGVVFSSKNSVHLYVFVGGNGASAGEIFTSLSGIGSKSTSTIGTGAGGGTTDLFSVTRDSNTGYFVAVGVRGTSGADIQYSATGTGTWTQTPGSNNPLLSTANAELKDVIFDAGFNKLITCGFDGTDARILITTNPSSVAWADPTTTVVADDWLALATNGSGKMVVVGDKDGSSKTAYSSDGGVNWSAPTTEAGGTGLLDVCFDEQTGAFYASGKSGKIYKSVDFGNNWTDKSPSGIGTDFACIASDGKGTVIATTGATLAKFYITQDGGSTWGWFCVSKGAADVLNVGGGRTLHFEGGRFFHFDSGDEDVWYSLKFGSEGSTS